MVHPGYKCPGLLDPVRQKQGNAENKQKQKEYPWVGYPGIQVWAAFVEADHSMDYSKWGPEYQVKGRRLACR